MVTSTRLASQPVVSFVKYMGSKAPILDFVVEGIAAVHDGGPVCDLFSGTAILAAAIGRQVPVLANDIQEYSRPLAGVYLTAWREPGSSPTGLELADEAEALVATHAAGLPGGLEYEDVGSLAAFNEVEARNRALIDRAFEHRWHFFLKTYSGTWWSARQCLWIDALREIAERHRGRPHLDLVLASLMHAMAYASQGTGHFAQYRDAKDAASMADISIYRRRSVRDYFVRKFDQVAPTLPAAPSDLAHEITALDYRERLATLGPSTVYADPPYVFVHYSRFYHALETVCRYDDPELQIKGGKLVKGRYREGRHQSPFSIRSEVPGAFAQMFRGVARSGSNLVLSYSNTGLIGFDALLDLARTTLGPGYSIEVLTAAHRHMTMGRKADRDRDVEERLILARR